MLNYTLKINTLIHYTTTNCWKAHFCEGNINNIIKIYIIIYITNINIKVIATLVRRSAICHLFVMFNLKQK